MTSKYSHFITFWPGLVESMLSFHVDGGLAGEMPREIILVLAFILGTLLVVSTIGWFVSVATYEIDHLPGRYFEPKRIKSRNKRRSLIAFWGVSTVTCLIAAITFFCVSDLYPCVLVGLVIVAIVSHFNVQSNSS